MKDFIKIGLAAVVMAVATDVMAQDKVEATVSADVVNQYIWRGTKCGEASVQPTLGVAYKGLSLTAWGSTETPIPRSLTLHSLTRWAVSMWE